MHKTLEKLITKQITIRQAIEFFNSKWSAIDIDVSESIAENTYDQLTAYLSGLTGKELDDYEILCVEKMVDFEIGGYKFKGAIDLLLRNANGDIIVVDHKSHKKLFGRYGKPLKSEEKTLRDYKRQMYLYCEIIHQMYGKYPSKLVWHHFKTGELSIVDYSEEEHQAAIKWALDTIEKIKQDDEFTNKKDFFFCHRICNYRNYCEYLDEDDE